MSLTRWLNSINQENKERWIDLRYDQVAVEFVKTLRSFPLMKVWSDTYAKKLLTVLDLEQCQQYQKDLDSFCSEKVDVQAFQAICKTIYIDFSAYHMINPLRQRLEQYLKTPLKRTPGLLEDIYKQNEENIEFQDNILRSSREVFAPGLKNFWKPQDIKELTAIRDSLFNNWNEMDFELTDKEYVQNRLRFCLAVRMDMVELSVAMNILGGDQWVEALSIFLRRTTTPEGFNLKDDPSQNPLERLTMVKDLLHKRSIVLNYLCQPERRRIPEGYLNCIGRGLNIPPYESFYGPHSKDRDTFKNTLSASL